MEQHEQDEQPQPARCGQAPAPKAKWSRKRKAWVISGSVFAFLVVVGAIGNATKKPVPAAAVSSPSAPPVAATSAPKPSPVRTSKPAAQPVPSHSTSMPRISHAPAAQKPSTDLAFSGAVSGTAVTTVDVLPKATTSNDGSVNSSGWSTQCVFDGDGTTVWSATIVVRTPGNEWSIEIAMFGQDPGNPKPGSHGGFEGQTNNPPADSLSLRVVSQHSVASYISPDTDGDTEFGYYTPMQDNGGDGAIVVDKGLTSGTLNVSLTPDTPANLVFNISGTWSCA